MDTLHASFHAIWRIDERECGKSGAACGVKTALLVGIFKRRYNLFQ
jgi:hypothetical protein